MFQFPLQKLDEQGNSQSTIHWNSLVRKHSNEFPFSEYVDKFLYTFSFLLNTNVEPRIGPEIKRFLHRGV